MTAQPTRPILRWHGGEWMLAPWIIANLPPHRIYVEPFAGAASVLMRKPLSYLEIINDLDLEVVNLFRVLRDESSSAKLCRLLSLTPFSREEFTQSYEVCDDPIERARRLVIRSFQGFGSNGHQRKTGWRNTTRRTGSSPAHDWANYPECLQAYTERLRPVAIENRDALELIAQQDSPETLFYVDPPYVRSTRDAGRDYAHELDEQGHRDLAAVLRSCKGMVVLSGYACPLYDKQLFPDWHRIERESLADGAKKRIEVLWINKAAMSARWGLGL